MRHLIVIAALVIGLAACDEPKSERDAKPKPKALSDTATVLPPGVREQWFAALDLAIKERLFVYKGRVRMYRFIGGVVYAPISNLEVECDPSAGISLVAEQHTKSNPFGLLIQLIGDSIAGDKDVPTPKLGVGDQSPAAISLMDDLCRHLVGRLETMRKNKKPTLTPVP